MPPPLARTNAEAHMYMDLHACEECGETRLEPESSEIVVDGDLASRYHGRCPACDAQREFVFRLPGEILLPPADRIRFGDDRPSELIDAGEWLWIADHIMSRIPEDPARAAPDEREGHRFDMTAAVAALEEALKVVPPGADEVPAETLWTERGREVYRERPGRFAQGSLRAVRDAYQELVDAVGQRKD